MDNGEKEQAVTSGWRYCIENDGTYQLPWRGRNLCGTTDNFGCPYLHPLTVLLQRGKQQQQFNVCQFKDPGSQWKSVLEDIWNRWGWVLAILSKEGREYDFQVAVKAPKGNLERSSLLNDYPLERMVRTQYFSMESKAYGFISPESPHDLTLRTVRRIFKRAQKQGMAGEPPSSLQIYRRSSFIPPSMEEETVTPLPTEAEISQLERIFIHEQIFADGQEVLFPIGGKGSHAQRVSMKMGYDTLYHLLAENGGTEKIVKVPFW